MSAVDEDDAGFWPGYVAAVSGLVQGLLIMAMALGISIYALGRLAVPADRAEGRRPSHQTIPLVVPTLGDPGSASTPPAALPVPMPPVLSPVTGQRPLAPLVRAGITMGVAVSFAMDAVELPPSSLPVVNSAVRRAQLAGAVRWRVVARVMLGDPRQERASFLRLIALRKVLVENGFAKDMIDLWIRPAENGGVAEGEQVRVDIIPIDAAGTPIEIAGAGQ